MVGVAGPGSLPRLKRWLDVPVHLFSLLVCPDLIVVSLASLPNVIVKSIDKDKTTKGTWAKVAGHFNISLSVGHLLLLLFAGTEKFT